jgi:hypothetical protein
MAARKAREQREARRLRSEGLRSIARHLGVSLSSVSVWTRGIQPVAAARPVQPETRPPEAQKPPETRICGGCRRRRELTEFHRQQSWCKQCRAEYIRDRGELHRRQTRAARDRRRAVARGHVLGLLTKARCADCGLADPLVLEFDHIGNKTAGVSFLVREGYRLARIKAEIACCEIVCANCHRRRTTSRAGGSWRLDLHSHVPAHRSIQRRNLQFILDHLRRSACVSCGERDVVVLEFDHAGPKRGHGVVWLAFQEHSIASLRAEIGQCEIRCSNCHRRQTIRRQPSHLRHHLLEPP